jgi:tetratricopeptide (TPR) repeat protein
MQRLLREFLIAALACGTLAGASGAQSSKKTVPPDASSTTQKGLSLAEGGRCREALPILKKYAPLAAERQLKVKGGLAAIRCGLALDQVEDVVNVVLWLTREFPSDPDVLYVSTHTYSDLSARFALQLGRTAPLSHQARELNAESLEAQAKWDDAAAEYKQILKQEPDLPGIHYRLGRVILSRPATATTAEDARAEFQAELKIDSKNAGAEYVLGELSRQAQQWEDAIEHFSRASKLDANFGDAFLGLGFSLNSAGRYAEAIPPLETEVRLQPANPTGHYQLTIAYSRTGRKEDAAKEMALFQQTSEKALKEIHGESQQPQEPAPPQ